MTREKKGVEKKGIRDFKCELNWWLTNNGMIMMRNNPKLKKKIYYTSCAQVYWMI